MEEDLAAAEINTLWLESVSFVDAMTGWAAGEVGVVSPMVEDLTKKEINKEMAIQHFVCG
jgi:hypothetical protein